MLCMHAVVFGSVLEGMGVVKRMEAVGSKSGQTARRVVIADCGELESRLQRALALQKQREEAAAAKKDPIGLDPDASAAARLRALHGEDRGSPAAGDVVPATNASAPAASDPAAAAEDAAAAAPAEQSEAAAAAAEAEDHSQEQEQEHEQAEEEDVMAGLSVRKRRLLELRAKSAKARKANENAAAAELRREKKGPKDPNIERKAWLESASKERQVRSTSVAVHSAAMLDKCNAPLPLTRPCALACDSNKYQ